MAKVNISLPEDKMSLEETIRYLNRTIGEIEYILKNLDENNLNKYFKERVKNGTVK